MMCEGDVWERSDLYGWEGTGSACSMMACKAVPSMQVIHVFVSVDLKCKQPTELSLFLWNFLELTK